MGIGKDGVRLLQKGKSRHRRSALLRQAVSFALLVIVLLLLFTFASQKFNTIFQEEIQHSNQLFLNIVEEIIDEKMQSLETSISFVCSNTQFNELFLGGKTNVTFHRRSGEVKDALNDYYKSSGVECLIYIPDWDYILTPTTANDFYPIFQRQKLNGAVHDETEWRDILTNQKNGFFFSTQHSLIDNELHLVYCKSLYMKRKPVMVYASIPISELNNAVNLSESTLLVTDSGGAVLASLGEDAALPEQQIPMEAHTIEGKDGGAYILTSGDSRRNTWKFIVATPETIYWASSTRVARLLAFTIAFAGMFGLVASVLLLRYNYRPMHNLMHTLRMYEAGKDEYAVITSAFQELQDENLSYKENIRSQNSKLREQYLLSRLKGRKYALQSRDFNLYYSIKTEGYAWCLVAVSAEPLFEGEHVPRKIQESEELINFALNNVFSELIEDWPHYQMEDGTMLFYLLYLDKEQLEQWDRNSRRIFEFVGDFFKEQADAVVSGAVSHFVDDFNQIDKLYLEVMRISEHRAVMGEIGIVSADAYEQQQNWLFHNTDWFQDLETAVSEGDEARSVALVNGAFSRLDGNSKSISILKIEVNECMYRILVAFNEIVSDREMQQQLINQTLDIAMHKESVSSLREKFICAVRYACTAIRESIRAVDNPLVQQIDAYVEENYSDVNLNVTTIAEHFGKHPNYISKIYLSETGTMLLDRLHKVRIRHAKELLRQGGITIEKVAEQTGFSNSRTFRRVFVKETGFNPGEYQSNDAKR